MDRNKELGQVWTPDWLVYSILDNIGYTCDNPAIINSKIMEPSFGSGAFLIEITRRLIDVCERYGMKTSDIEDTVNRNIYGIEYDANIFMQTLQSLKLLCSSYGFNVPFNNLVRMDALDYNPAVDFDYIVGNPPYVRIQSLSNDMREKMSKLSAASGNTDLYIAFYDICINWLELDGKLSFISPSGWMKGSSQKYFRAMLSSTESIISIHDYSDIRIFDGVDTYTAVLTLRSPVKSMVKHISEFTYYRMNSNNQMAFSTHVKFNDFKDGKSLRLLCLNSNEKKILKICLASDYKNSIQSNFIVSNGVATLSDSVFLINDGNFNNDSLIYPAIKASKYHGGSIDAKIIFPYIMDASGRFNIIDENELLRNHSLVYNHLIANKDILEKRKRDKGTQWYAYGRSQSIQITNKQKLIINPIVSPDSNISAYIIPAGTIIYSGLVITEYDNGMPLKKLIPIIESNLFHEYAMIVGSPMSGGYRRLSSPDVKSFSMDVINNKHYYMS